ncbi:hypothetical protein [Actinocatenispora comari]|uniref:hypothetical protein n=1 Tax=Actinocatenispora comari TaxID=2807577 RepID=UPI001A937DFD|nr:hypothetical protein [Actinocatenispora comari]
MFATNKFVTNVFVLTKRSSERHRGLESDGGERRVDTLPNHDQSPSGSAVDRRAVDAGRLRIDPECRPSAEREVRRVVTRDRQVRRVPRQDRDPLFRRRRADPQRQLRDREGKIVGLNAPDTEDETAPGTPSFTAADLGENSSATLSVSTGSYVKAGAAGITSSKHDGVWIMTLSGTELGSTSVEHPDPITVDGTITCGRTIAMP